MEKRVLTFSNQGISVIGTGGSIYNPDQQYKKNFENVINNSYKNGINFFDTAQDYNQGLGEKYLGNVLHQINRKSFVVGTKFHAVSQDEVVPLVKESLRNLRLDFIDILYIHWPKKNIDLKDMMIGLEKCRRLGLIKAIGASNMSIKNLIDINQVGHLDVYQLCYNLLWRKDEYEVIPYCKKNNIDLVVYSSLAQGILTGKYAKNLELAEGDVRRNSIYFQPNVWPLIYETVEEFKKIAIRENVPLAKLAIEWALKNQSVVSCLISMKNISQSNQIISMFNDNNYKLSQIVYKELTQISNNLLSEKIFENVSNIFRYNPN
ncbi:MAG: aldo/keto reductase [Pleomorphochaeta sp.]